MFLCVQLFLFRVRLYMPMRMQLLARSTSSCSHVLLRASAYRKAAERTFVAIDPTAAKQARRGFFLRHRSYDSLRVLDVKPIGREWCRRTRIKHTERRLVRLRASEAFRSNFVPKLDGTRSCRLFPIPVT